MIQIKKADRLIKQQNNIDSIIFIFLHSIDCESLRQNLEQRVNTQFPLTKREQKMFLPQKKYFNLKKIVWLAHQSLSASSI